jgi:hypothetical protein
MLKHIPTAVFGLSIFAIIANASLEGRADVFLGAVIAGMTSIAVILIKEKWDKGPPPPVEEQIQLWTRERDNLRMSLDSARRDGALDRVAFLEPKLAEAETKLRKLAR